MRHLTAPPSAESVTSITRACVHQDTRLTGSVLDVSFICIQIINILLNEIDNFRGRCLLNRKEHRRSTIHSLFLKKACYYKPCVFEFIFSNFKVTSILKKIT